MNKKQRIYQRINKHGENLNKIFNTGIENVTLCKKLFRLENKANHAATCLCNTNTLNLLELNQYTGYNVHQATEKEQNCFFDKIRNSVIKILGNKSKKMFFINFDPRGYSLKLRVESVKECNIYKDWGDFGIIAPDFNE